MLREECTEVTQFNKELGTLLNNMAETMYHNDGAGLAAPQIGVTQRIFLIDVSHDNSALTEFINPKIISAEGSYVYEEGCLSIPSYREKVKRSQKVTVEAQDRKGEVFHFQGEDVAAVAIQHELDHLNGVLFIDHLSRIKKELFKTWWKKQSA